MRDVKRLVWVLVAMVASVGADSAARAGTIQFEARDLADVVAGEDLWEYEYFLSGFTFGANTGFTIYASEAVFMNLTIPTPPTADWDAQVVEPDTTLASPGWYDALALQAAPSLSGPFLMRFVWLGGPKTPGSQPFDIYELDSLGNLTVVDDGRTVPRSLPEPATALLVVAGLGALRATRRRRAA